MAWQGPWTVHGRLDGDDVFVSWEDGHLSGTDSAVTAVRAALDGQDQVQLSPSDEERDADAHDSHAAMVGVEQVLEIVRIEGDPPIPDADDSAS